MRLHVAPTSLLLVVLVAGCSSGADDPEQTAPTVLPSSVLTSEPVTPSPTQKPTCNPFRFGKVSKVGAGFIVEFNIMSGMPNPAWRLSKAEGVEFRRLLQASRSGIEPNGPDEMGGYGVTADRGRTASFLRGLELPERFWVRRNNNQLARFLGGTTPCDA